MSRVLVSLEDVGLAPGGRRLSLELAEGDAYAAMGPATEGCKALLEAIATGRAPVGRIVHRAPVIGGIPAPNRRATPQGIAVGPRGENDGAARNLMALGLWEDRQTPVAQLSPELSARIEILAALASEARALILDGRLDSLDPWCLPRVLETIDEERSAGRAFVVGTARPDVAEALGAVIVVTGGSPVFAGSVQELLRSSGPVELVVESDEAPAIRQIVEPFCLEARPAEKGLVIRAENGQALAARLLTEGYGSVRAVLLRAPTLGEALRALTDPR